MTTRPPYDPDLAAMLSQVAYPPTLRVAEVSAGRAAWPPPAIGTVLQGHDVSHREVMIPGYDGATLILSIFSSDESHPRGGVLLIHGGGMYAGHRFHEAAAAVDMVERHGVVVAAVEYRLAPEHPHPIPVEDCAAALKRLRENAAVLGTEPERLIVRGTSAGGGLAAAVALLARDRDGPRLLGQMLLCPMLDHGNDSTSARQFADTPMWNRQENAVGWEALLGPEHPRGKVSAYASPVEAESLADLPPAYPDVGSAEVFRSEVVSYAERLWASGGDAELHVWTGGFHDFENGAPETRIARASRDARDGWLGRILRR